MENQTTNQPQQTSGGQQDGKTIAIISHITLIGWVIALIMHGSNKTSIGAFYLRQMLGLLVLGIATFIIRIPLLFIPFLGWALSSLIGIALLVLWILSIISAANGEEKEIPVFGKMFQNWFAGVGK
ncbi:MAG: hypothetical protein JSU07_10185 [Bacteroidetes bacterium]|nr:hypothetical protein [Bacteroidota bacterium]